MGQQKRCCAFAYAAGCTLDIQLPGWDDVGLYSQRAHFLRVQTLRQGHLKCARFF